MTRSPHGSPGAPGVSMAEIVRRVVQRIPDRQLRAADWDVVYRDMHSNDVAEVHFADGRVLHVKRVRGPGAAARCATSRRASELLRERAGLVAPAHLDMEPPMDEPVIAYWRLRERTLDVVMALWPPERPDLETLRSLGGLMRRIQSVELTGHGSLGAPDATLADFLEEDVGQRLRPAVHGEWPAGAAPVDRLLQVVDRWVRDQPCPSVLVHNDLHVDNVLCRGQGRDSRCVGVLDLEDALAGAPEADLAKVEVLHGPLFGRPWPAEWLDVLLRGYDLEPHAFRRGLMRVYHLLNLGFYAAHIGLAERAHSVAEAAALELDALGEDLPHARVVAGVPVAY